MKEGNKITTGTVTIEGYDFDDMYDKPMVINIEKDYLGTKYGRTLKIKSYTPPAEGSSLGGFEFYGKDDRYKFGLKPFTYCESRIVSVEREEDYLQSLKYYELEHKGIREGSTIVVNDLDYLVEKVEYSKENFEYITTLVNGDTRIDISTFDIQKDDVLDTPYTFREKLEQVVGDNTDMFTETDKLIDALEVFIKNETGYCK